MFSEKFLRFIEIWRDDFAFERSLQEKACVDKDGNPLPWYTYPAIEYLSQFDYSQKKVFEYGCGMSSLYWARRALSVTSIEDNPGWFEKLSPKVAHPNLEIKLREEGEAYENAILETDGQFDVVVIDGKRRAECAAAVVKKLVPGGMVILDDSDRANTSDEYKKAIGILRQENLLQVDFYGFCPMNNFTKTTSVFFCRDFDFKSKSPIQPANGWGNLWGMSRKKRKEAYKGQM